MDSGALVALIGGVGGLIIFMLNRIFDNKDRGAGERRDPDQSVIGVYSELLHISTLCTKLDMGMAELIRVNSDPDSKVSTVRLREDMRELRKELNEDIESLRRALAESKKED